MPPQGLPHRLAAITRSLRPSRRPELWGPSKPLPPLKVTRSNPILTYSDSRPLGGTSAAASLKVGTPCFFPMAAQVCRSIRPLGLKVLIKKSMAVPGLMAASNWAVVSTSTSRVPTSLIWAS